MLKLQREKLSQSWMFKGAYATYEGQINNHSTTCKLSAEITVVNINVSHVEVHTTSTIATSFMPALTDQSLSWLNKSNINFQPTGETLENIYPTQVSVRSIGTRNCTAYEYTNEAINATYYIDNVLFWPVRITYTTTFENQTYLMEFNVKDTNIRELSSAI